MRVWNDEHSYVTTGMENGKLYNETVVEILGRSANETTQFRVEAEIHDFKSDEAVFKTYAKAFEAIKQFRPKWTTEVQSAIREKRNAKNGNWVVKHENGNLLVIYQHLPNWEYNE